MVDVVVLGVLFRKSTIFSRVSRRFDYTVKVQSACRIYVFGKSIKSIGKWKEIHRWDMCIREEDGYTLGRR